VRGIGPLKVNMPRPGKSRVAIELCTSSIEDVADVCSLRPLLASNTASKRCGTRLSEAVLFEAWRTTLFSVSESLSSMEVVESLPEPEPSSELIMRGRDARLR
jgi:hypothetical protein